MSVRTAALVLAYRYPIGLSALARYFDLTGTDMFVHVDAKIDETAFREAAAAATQQVTFLPDRIAVFWRGFTVVEATIALLKAARAQGYDRYLLISDDSLPIVGPDTFQALLSPEEDYFAARPAEDELRLRYDRFYMFDSAVTQARWLALSDRHVDAETVDRFTRLGKLMKRGKKPLETCYHASQWMALTWRSVDTILK
ncbi:MAG TPA: beta-1,6-N-acetylglucosaminyltransferase, partial [Alphaproteobacteria bacterium]|nr:beta-1,6-N-acetylglucosaminyltransferase [Alphaproteobacteria bacterium]